MTRMPRLASWRLPAADRLAQDSFLADLDTHWTPRSVGDHALELRSQLTHLLVRLFDGSPSLAPVALALPMSVLGMMLFAVTTPPVDPMFVPGPPGWAYLLMTAGLISMSVEAAISPRAIRARPFLFRAALPIAAGATVIAAELHIVDMRDEVLRAGLVAMALAVVAVGVTAGGRWPRRHRLLLRVAGLAFWASVGPNAGWAVTYANHGFAALAVAAALTALAAAMIGAGLSRARIEPPVGAVPQQR